MESASSVARSEASAASTSTSPRSTAAPPRARFHRFGVGEGAEDGQRGFLRLIHRRDGIVRGCRARRRRRDACAGRPHERTRGRRLLTMTPRALRTDARAPPAARTSPPPSRRTIAPSSRCAGSTMPERSPNTRQAGAVACAPHASPDDRSKPLVHQCHPLLVALVPGGVRDVAGWAFSRLLRVSNSSVSQITLTQTGPFELVWDHTITPWRGGFAQKREVRLPNRGTREKTVEEGPNRPK